MGHSQAQEIMELCLDDAELEIWWRETDGHFYSNYPRSFHTSPSIDSQKALPSRRRWQTKSWHTCLLEIQRNVFSDTDFSQEEQAWEVLVYAGTSCGLSSMSRTPSSCQANLTFTLQAGNPASYSAIDNLAESSYFQILRFLYLALTSLCP